MSDSAAGSPHGNRTLAFSAFAALGVVYGDLGTSPLYSLRESFSGSHSVALNHDNVLGLLSLVFWSLNFVISFKYIALVMRADNRGEGGILALLALVRPGGQGGSRRGLLLLVGIFGAALLYGDGVITPAITVLGALEGLATATPAIADLLAPGILPLAVLILTALFWVQHRGTDQVGKLFGPATTLWFFTIALLGIRGIAMNPGILAALDPRYAIAFFAREGLTGFKVLTAVVLVLTGGEALYADMGHFGRRPIQVAWFAIVLPALTLNYFGQGAWLLTQESLGEQFNPFYALVPSWALIPVVIIAASAAVAASQALISGAFSLTQQAMQLGFTPRMQIRHTSRTTIGQIYMPGVNWALWAGCVALVLAFRSSENLAAAYGVAVTGTMFTTSILFAAVMFRLWRWPLWKVIPITLAFVVVDLAFMGANMLKFFHGGWFPIMVAVVVFILMGTWKKGRQQVTALLRESSLPLELFIPDMARRDPPRVPGTAVFMTSLMDVAPPVLLHHLKHNKVLHERVILMTLSSVEIPQVDPSIRVTVESCGEGFYKVVARYGFMETPEVAAILQQIAYALTPPEGGAAPPLQMHQVTFYLGRETLIVGPRRRGDPRPEKVLPVWRVKLFEVMSRNALGATAFFGLPPNRVVELGAQLQL